MIFVCYGFVALGAGLLILDVRRNFWMSPRRVVVSRVIALVMSGVAAFFPLLSWQSDLLQVSPGGPFPYIATGYVIFWVAFAAGMLPVRRFHWLIVVRRIGYAGLLVLSAIPSWVLLILAVPIGLAGIALARSDTEVRGGAVRGSPAR